MWDLAILIITVKKMREVVKLYEPETGKKENFVRELEFHRRIDVAAPTSGLHEQDRKESRVAEIITDICQFRFIRE